MSRPSHTRTALTLTAALTLGPAAVVLALLWGPDAGGLSGDEPLSRHSRGSVASTTCKGCHPDQYRSWSATFHRTMTQRPEPRRVAGVFDGRTLAFAGQEARPLRHDDRFLFELPAPGNTVRRAEVALMVGSRRYQQYFEEQPRDGGTALVRLPWLWHISEQHWMHINTVFLRPDDGDWKRHASTWNANCIFCHNTAPQPGLEHIRDTPALNVAAFDSTVGELGISCESCHGPGAEHSARMRSPQARWKARREHEAEGPANRLAAGAAPIAHPGDSSTQHGASRLAIIPPQRLSPPRQLSLCGQCHGQRLPAAGIDVADLLVHGPGYRPGDDLLTHVVPIRRDTPVPPGSEPTLFNDRFWGDGTPRLTAYEYQGLSASACYQQGGLTCLGCHTMHGGDPRGMITADKRGDGACLSCHDDLAVDHSRHDSDGPGGRCLDCHMPRIVYGVLALHRSHRIDSPDPLAHAAAGRPDACAACHIERSTAWLAQQRARLWSNASAGRLLAEVAKHPPGRDRTPSANATGLSRRADGAPLDISSTLADLHAGDVVARSVAIGAITRLAETMGGSHRADTSPALPEVAIAAPSMLSSCAALAAHLAIATGDGYPNVRRLARRGLLALDSAAQLGLAKLLAPWDPGERPTDSTLVFALLDRLPRLAASEQWTAPPPGLLMDADGRLDLATVRTLLDLQSDHVIAMGE